MVWSRKAPNRLELSKSEPNISEPSRCGLQNPVELGLNKPALSKCESQNLAGLARSKPELSRYESQSLAGPLVPNRCESQNPVTVNSSFFVEVAGKRAMEPSKMEPSKMEPNCGIRFGPLRQTTIVRLRQMLPRHSMRKYGT